MCNENYASDQSDSCVFNINFNLDNIKKIHSLMTIFMMILLFPALKELNVLTQIVPDAKPEIVYIQYDKENMKFIYVCLSCHREKIEPHIGKFS